MLSVISNASSNFPSLLNFAALSRSFCASAFTFEKLTNEFCPRVSDVTAFLASGEYILECTFHAFSSPNGPNELPSSAWPKKSCTARNISLFNNGTPFLSLNPLSLNNGFSFRCCSVIGESP